MIPPPNPVISSEYIYDRASFASCHASTIVETRRGTLLTAWFGGSHEGASDVAIYLSRLIDGKWTPPEAVAKGLDSTGHQIPCWNPVLFENEDGRLTLFYKVGREIPKWSGMFESSMDDGVTWSSPVALPRGILGPIKNKPVRLASGRILSGSSEEAWGWKVHFEYSDDDGKSWKRTPSVNQPGVLGAIQPTILERPDGSVVALGRTPAGKIFETASSDLGTTWKPLILLNINNPNSGIDAVRVDRSKYLLAFNDALAHRTPLDLAISDDGIRWKHIYKLETKKGEFSYPAIIQTKDGNIHVTYTWNRVKIKHVVLNLKTLLVIASLDSVEADSR